MMETRFPVSQQFIVAFLVVLLFTTFGVGMAMVFERMYPRVRIAVEDVVGCYELVRVSSASTAIDSQATATVVLDSAIHVELLPPIWDSTFPPRIVRIVSESGASASFLDGTADLVRYWKPRNREEFVIAQSGGFSGAWLTLRMDRDSVQGTFNKWTDIADEEIPVDSVRGRKIRCMHRSTDNEVNKR